MTVKPYLSNCPPSKPTLIVGERVKADVRRQICELEARLPSAMSTADRRNLHKLKTFLHLLQTGGDDHE